MLGAITATGDFSMPTVPVTTCPSPIPSGSSCYMYVVFRPTGTGLRTGNLIINESSPDSTQTVKLEGTGIGALVSPAALVACRREIVTTDAARRI